MQAKFALAAAATLLSASIASAQDASGDAEAGEAVFRQCAACHNVVNDDGDVLAGRPNIRTGPNLYGVAGRTVGTVEDFRYSPGLQALNEMEVVWEEENFVTYIQDPTGYIRETAEDDSLRGSMAAQRMRGDTDAVDLYAYIASLE
ncbi:MAG: c-type cytochrome [Roseicyclus sp.]